MEGAIPRTPELVVSTDKVCLFGAGACCSGCFTPAPPPNSQGLGFREAETRALSPDEQTN